MGAQSIVLDPSQNCLQPHIVMHEIGHAIGFYHEHNRPDRDEYVKIITRNIDKLDPELQDEYDRLKTSQVNSLGVGYDYNSIMHYDRYVGTVDSNGSYVRLEIIQPRDPNITVGEARGLSPLDIIQTNRLYGCSKLTHYLKYLQSCLLAHVLLSLAKMLPAICCGLMFCPQERNQFTTLYHGVSSTNSKTCLYPRV